MPSDSARPVSQVGRTLAAAFILFTVGCTQQNASEEGNNAAESVEATEETNLASALPLPRPALDRAAFLAALSAAASAHTSGTDDTDAQSALDGRRFAIRLRFGCDGPASANVQKPMQWTTGADGKSFEVRATPDLSRNSPPIEAIGKETIESVEGFWIARPWQYSDNCPATAAPQAETVGGEGSIVQRSGIAEYFTEEDSRVRSRSGRAYTAVRKVDSLAGMPKKGIVLLLEGRLTPWPDGRIIACSGSGRTSAPTCIASAHLDRAAFVNPESGEEIAEWRD